MTEKRLIDWADLDSDTQEAAIRTVVRIARVRREEAEDLVADALLKVMILRPVVRNARGLLVRAALNILRSRRDQIDAQTIRFGVTEDLEHTGDSVVREGLTDRSPGPLLQVVEAEEQMLRSAHVLHVLEGMSTRDREILKAAYFDDRTPTEIDRERGDGPGTASVRLHRARRRFLKAACIADGDTGHSR